MQLFLNTSKLNTYIPKLITSSEKELIIVVPYIQVSETIYKSLKKADEKGVEITIIYRENKLSELEKKKIRTLNNLNLLYHPNIHCKCYYNGSSLIISSMNMYEYSEKNNREMGVFFHLNYDDVWDEYYDIICKNYYDNIDVILDERRFKFEIQLSKKEKEKLFDIWRVSYAEFEFKGFKYYWNYHTQPIYLYKDGNYDWHELTDEQRLKKSQQGINAIIKKYRSLTGK